MFLKLPERNYVDTKRKLAQRIEVEIKEKVKGKFDYPIPVVEVNKAGITSTGSPCENELEDVAKEFDEYRKSTCLWKSDIDESFLSN